MFLFLAAPAVTMAAAPIITSLASSDANDVIEPGEAVTITVQAHDPDCPDVCTDACGQAVRQELTLWSADGGTFTSENNGTTGSPYTASAVWQAPEATGIYTIGISLSDNGAGCGGPAVTTDSLAITVNNRPTALSDLIFGANTEDNHTVVTGNVLADNGYGADYDIDGDPVFAYGFASNWPLPDDGSFVCDADPRVEFCMNKDGAITCEFFGDWNDLSEGEFTGYEFEYWIHDTKAANMRADRDSHLGKVGCFIRGVNDPVTAVDRLVFVPEDIAVRSFSVYYDEPDFDDLFILAASFDCPSCKRPDHGTVVSAGGVKGEYSPEEDYAGDDSFGFEVCDNFVCDTGLVTVTVTPVNDSPINSVPGPQFTGKNIPLVFSASSANALAVSDVDGGTADLQVSLIVDEGTLTLSGSAGLNGLSGDGTGSLSLTGPLTALNAALDGLNYLPPTDYIGAAMMTVTTDDLGNAGSGGALSDTDTVAITVTDASSFYLVVTPAGTGAGTVTSSPVGIDCGADCTGSFNPGETVQLAASSAAGSAFVGWGGDCSVPGTVFMDGSKNCTATFDLVPLPPPPPPPPVGGAIYDPDSGILDIPELRFGGANLNTGALTRAFAVRFSRIGDSGYSFVLKGYRKVTTTNNPSAIYSPSTGILDIPVIEVLTRPGTFRAKLKKRNGKSIFDLTSGGKN